MSTQKQTLDKSRASKLLRGFSDERTLTFMPRKNRGNSGKHSTMHRNIMQYQFYSFPFICRYTYIYVLHFLPPPKNIYIDVPSPRQTSPREKMMVLWVLDDDDNVFFGCWEWCTHPCSLTWQYLTTTEPLEKMITVPDLGNHQMFMFHVTPLKANISPEIWWLEDEMPFKMVLFLGDVLIFRGLTRGVVSLHRLAI